MDLLHNLRPIVKNLLFNKEKWKKSPVLVGKSLEKSSKNTKRKQLLLIKEQHFFPLLNQFIVAVDVREHPQNRFLEKVLV